MRLLTLFITTLTIIPSFISAAAVPTVAPRNETLVKRGGEVNYLANCKRYNDEDDVDYAASYIAWYANVDNSLSGHDIPNSLSNEYRDWSHGDGASLHWEGQQQNIHFKDSGVTVQTHIDADAGSRGFTAWAGWAQRTSDWKVFNCYKDNSRPLFIWTPPVPDGTQNSVSCWSIYWCV